MTDAIRVQRPSSQSILVVRKLRAVYSVALGLCVRSQPQKLSSTSVLNDAINIISRCV